MTIAAGFSTRDGILLCADSLFMGGTKTHQEKLFGYRFNENTAHACSLAFSMAGHENNASMAIEDSVEAIAECPPEKRTGKRIKEILRSVVHGINATYVDGRPDAE